MAMQEQQVNPMAPSYNDYDQESQIPPWAPQSDLESQVDAQPLFRHSHPGDKFGFQVPSANGTQYTMLHDSSLLSSHSLSTFLITRSCRGSTVPM